MRNQHFLQGYRVLDLSQYIPGPYATRQLADLGADVIKIEPPGGDPMRHFMYSETGPVSPFYRHLNRGKRVLGLDLKSDTGAGVLQTLITGADVLLESFRPGVLDRLGFGREQLEQINERLIHCTLSGFGQTGPYRLRAGHDLTYCAVSGSLSPSHASDPTVTFPPLADHAGAMQAVNAILAALLGRERTARGAFLDISLCESALSWQYLGLQDGPSGQARQILTGGAAYYNIYRTADRRFVALAPLEPKFWQAFCDAVEHPGWVARQSEPLPQAALIGQLRELFASRPLEYWLDRLNDVDCCFEPIPPMESVEQHPQIKSRRMLHGDEPSYPAWIDGDPVSLGADMEEITETEQVSWRKR